MIGRKEKLLGQDLYISLGGDSEVKADYTKALFSEVKILMQEEAEQNTFKGHNAANLILTVSAPATAT